MEHKYTLTDQSEFIFVSSDRSSLRNDTALQICGQLPRLLLDNVRKYVDLSPRLAPSVIYGMALQDVGPSQLLPDGSLLFR